MPRTVDVNDATEDTLPPASTKLTEKAYVTVEHAATVEVAPRGAGAAQATGAHSATLGAAAPPWLASQAGRAVGASAHVEVVLAATALRPHSVS